MRPAYRELHISGGNRSGVAPRNPIELGRRFCSGCGHWRHLCDFAWKTDRSTDRARPRERCRACTRIQLRQIRANYTPEQRATVNEYYRIWSDAKRRAAGVPKRRPRAWTAVGRAAVERVLLDREPIVAEIERFGNDKALARRSGVPERSIRRLRTGESARVRLDIADRLAVAVGVPLALIYSETLEAAA